MGRGLTVWLAAASLVASPTTAQTTAAFADLPNVAFSFYDLGGSDAATLRAEMDRLRPTDPNDGSRVDALSNANWRLAWGNDSRGCNLAGASITFSATVRLPHLSDSAALPPDVRAAWDRYIAALEAHEAWHVRNGYDGRLEILAAVKNATCATANATAKAAIATVNARDLAYDQSTRHGAADGATF